MTTMEQDQERIEVSRTMLRLNSKAWGIAVGMLLGTGLFLATVILVAKGGPDMGQHLGLLSAYLPGYRVSLLGSVIGFAYAFVIGYALGRVIGSVYNRLVGAA
jgi:amino acid permease